MRGRAAEYLGDGSGSPFFQLPSFVFADLSVKLFDGHLGDLTDTELLELFLDLDAPPGEEDQLYYDLKAYAQGIEDFRQHLAAGVGLSGNEPAMRQWLIDNGSWALFDPVTYRDVDPADYDVHDAFYHPNGSAKIRLSAQDVNEIVEFLLRLGGWYDAEGAASADGTPSKKEAAFEAWISGNPQGQGWGAGKHLRTPHAAATR